MFVALPHILRNLTKAQWLLGLAVLLTGTMTIAIMGRLGHPSSFWTTPNAADALTNSNQTDSQDTKLTVTNDTATVVGIVDENVKRCTVDLSCYLELRFQGEAVNVVYVNTEGKACPNEKASHQGLAVKRGQRVEAHGQYQKEGNVHLISTCPSNNFYIKVL